MIQIPPEFSELSDDEKRLCATLYWLGVCIGEAVTLGVSSDDIRSLVEECIRTAIIAKHAPDA